MLYVVRHGRTEVNAAGKLLGRGDPELDETVAPQIAQKTIEKVTPKRCEKHRSKN